MPLCTEHKLLPPRPEIRKRKKKSCAKKRRKTIPWPKVKPGCVRVFTLLVGGTPKMQDLPKEEHLASLQELCEHLDIETTTLGEVISTKDNPTGRSLVVYSDGEALHHERHLNGFFGGDFAGNLVVGAQSAKTGALVNVQKTDIDKARALWERTKKTREEYEKEVVAAGSEPFNNSQG